MTYSSSVYLSNTILNKITVKPVRNNIDDSNTCYKCTNRKPKCVCWI